MHVTPKQPDKPHQRAFGREAVFATVVAGNYSNDPRTVCVFENVGITVAKQGNASVPVYPTDSPTWLNVLDQGVFNAVFSLFAGKAYAIFALLFGFTFYIQSNNQKRQGKDFGYRFLWRLVLLAGFATLNAAFFPAGDVLLLFVVVGLVLFLTRNWSDKAILVTSIIFLLQPVEWYHYVAN